MAKGKSKRPAKLKKGTGISNEMKRYASKQGRDHITKMTKNAKG
jgi:hypothetical protein